MPNPLARLSESVVGKTLGGLSLIIWVFGGLAGLLAGGLAWAQTQSWPAVFVWSVLGLAAGVLATAVGREEWPRLKGLLELGEGDEGEPAPQFHLAIQEPVTLARVSSVPGGEPEAIMCVFRVRVTNTGDDVMAALDWRAWVDLADGRSVQVQHFTSADHRLHQAATGTISRDDLIWERTAPSLTKGETRYGYFCHFPRA